MTLTQLIDNLRTYQATHGNVEVYLGQASGPDCKAAVVQANATQNATRVTIYPEWEDKE